MNYENIFLKNGRYVIKKKIYCKEITYGTFNNLTKAIEQRDILIKNRWHKNATTKYPKKQHFPKYEVKKTEDGYLILNKKIGRAFGTYKNYEYARLIKRILPFYGNKVNIEKIEQIAHKEFYKHISYNKRISKYHVIYKGFVRSTHDRLDDALYERDLIKKSDNEEVSYEDPTIVHDYKSEKLPSFEYEYENITYGKKMKNRYILEKRIRNQKIIIGSYPTYDLARLIKRHLDNKKWNYSEVYHIIKSTITIHKRDKHIREHDGYFYIEVLKDDEKIIYAKYKDIDLARYVKNNLVRTNWRKKFIKKFEKKYFLNKIETEYYYDSTDFFMEISWIRIRIDHEINLDNKIVCCCKIKKIPPNNLE